MARVLRLGIGVLVASAALALMPDAPALAAGPASSPGLSVREDGTLVRDGRPFRGIGVNYFDAFYRTLLRPGDTSYEAGFKALAEAKIPFARFMCGGFWPSEMRAYLDDPEAYFRKLDAVVRSAERSGVGLIPSLFWNLAAVPDLVGEPCDQWGSPGSKTHAFMRQYTRRVVMRYRDSPAVWGWEFGNEYNLAADLPNAADHRPQVVPRFGTPAARTARDELTHDMVRTALAEFAREVRKYDPHRIITSGNSIPRPSAWHQRAEKSWARDTPDEYAEMLLGDNPDPLSVISVHAYGENVARIAMTAEIAAKAKKPLFVGEFGVPGPPTPETEKAFADLLAAVEKARVPLAAVWVYDRGEKDEFNVSPAGLRTYQFKAVAEANERIRRELEKTASGR